MLDISILFGGSMFTPDRYTFESGLSIVYIYPSTSKIGLAFNSTKLPCAECNTPVAEVAAGSLIIRSKHHGSRHTTILSKSEITALL